jgi:hypothetical protein
MGANTSYVGNALPDNEVDLLFSEFLCEGMSRGLKSEMGRSL